MTDNQREREEISRQLDSSAITEGAVQSDSETGDTPVEKGAFAKEIKSTDCGPKEVKATDKGNWDSSKVAARNSARTEARAAAKDTCRGNNCPSTKSCKYLEKSNSIGGLEERKDPSGGSATEYRYECTSEGTCQCE